MNMSMDRSNILFILNIMPTIMFDKYEIPNVSFDFKEKEGKEFVLNIIKDHIEKHLLEKKKLYENILNPDFSKPVIEVSNYKLFFKYIYKLYYSYLNSVNKKDIPYELEFISLYKYLWLRMIPEDFTNIENFLLKQIKIFEDNTFINQDVREVYKSINDYDINIENRISKHYDEAPKEMLFTISNNNNEISLPLVRYGIYQKDNEKVCEISSIQMVKQIDDYDYDKLLTKNINKLRYKFNDGVNKDLIDDVEPKKLMSLLLFIKLLKDNNISLIHVPSLYVLDYEFHKKRNDVIEDLFKSEWSAFNQVKYPAQYENALKEYYDEVNKQDLISSNKSTNFIHLFERLLYHIKDIDILEYPTEVSSYLKFRINSLDNINNDYVRKLIK